MQVFESFHLDDKDLSQSVPLLMIHRDAKSQGISNNVIDEILIPEYPGFHTTCIEDTKIYILAFLVISLFGNVPGN